MELGIVLDTVTVNIWTITEWVSLMVGKYYQRFKNLFIRQNILKEVRIFQSNPANLLLDEFSSHLQGKYPWKSAQDRQSMEMTRISIWYQPRDQEVTQLIRFSLESEVPKARHFIHFM